jgi:hypothetical protein
VLKVVEQDESDSVYTCQRLADLEHAAKWAYYTARIIALLP